MSDNAPRGERHHASKLTEQQVRDIRASYKKGVNQYDPNANGYDRLAKAYGVDRQNIKRIVLGLIHKHVE